jgi:hypothetical protein
MSMEACGSTPTLRAIFKEGGANLMILIGLAVAVGFVFGKLYAVILDVQFVVCAERMYGELEVRLTSFRANRIQWALS